MLSPVEIVGYAFGVRSLTGSQKVIRLAGITYRQLDYWCRAGHLPPVVEAAGSGSRRQFGVREVTWAVFAGRLLDAGMELSEAAKVAERLVAGKKVQVEVDGLRITYEDVGVTDRVAAEFA